MKEIDRLFFRKHLVDPDDEAFMSDDFLEGYFGSEQDQDIEEGNLDERDWLG